MVFYFARPKKSFPYNDRYFIAKELAHHLTGVLCDSEDISIAVEDSGILLEIKDPRIEEELRSIRGEFEKTFKVSITQRLDMGW